MSNRNYYYLISSLPKLRLDDYAERYRLDNFITDLGKLLTEEHFVFVRDILCSYDNALVIDALLGYESPRFSRHGNWMFDEVKRSLRSAEYRFSDYINEFLAEYNSQKKERGFSRAELEDMLAAKFYSKMAVHPNQLIKGYFTFDRDLRNILVALNKKKFDIDRDSCVGDLEDEVINNLRRSSLSDFGLSRDLDYILELIEHFKADDIVSFQKYVDQLRWNKIDSINTFKYFEIDALLGYLIKFLLVERWHALGIQTGDDIFRQRTKVSLATA